MKKLIITFCLLLPLLCQAQNVQTLKNQADTLRKHGKEKKAGKLYKKAIDRVLTYKERITDYQWLSLSLAAHENEFNLTKKEQPYLCFDYGNNGSILKDKIKQLTFQNAHCIFTYYEMLTARSIIQMVRDTVSGKYLGFNYNNNRLLVWMTGSNVYFQEFSSSNIYKPLVIQNDTLRNLLIEHGNEVAHETLKKLRFKVSESPFAVFEFRNGAEINSQSIAYPKYLADTDANSNTYLSKLLPLIWRESRLYREKATEGI